MITATKQAKKSAFQTTKTAKVYSYLRFSHPSQRKGRGKKRQDNLALQWCEENGHTLEKANAYADLGMNDLVAKKKAEPIQHQQ